MSAATSSGSAEQRRYRLVDSLRQAVFVIGTGAVVLIAARNSITW
jgi:hypothetical protein